MPRAPALVWLRDDLRLADNPALAAAAASGRPLVVLYLLAERPSGAWPPGGAARWWLHGSLERLNAALISRGLRLTLQRGAASERLPGIVAEAGIAELYWTRRYDPDGMACDRALKAHFATLGIPVHSLPGNLLHEPRTVTTKSGTPFKVFAPFWAALRDRAPAAPQSAPMQMAAADPIDSCTLADLKLREGRAWEHRLDRFWTPGEQAARQQLAAFLDGPLDEYERLRDRPDLTATSSLSAHLHFGEISARQIWHAVAARTDQGGGFLRELAWREFCQHQLFHWPDLPDHPLRPAFGRFPWAGDDDTFDAWRHGRTGYPIVDAGMRQLWQTGWMHNRVRMITASFLTKHLLVPWQNGAAWFWDTLVDADLASNAANWQWVAGCGLDAAPYFRIFNPVLQGGRFDPQGDYIRRFVPELAPLPASAIHAPWRHADALARAGIVLGRDYPAPVIDHDTARRRALSAYASLDTGRTAVADTAGFRDR